LYLGTLVGQVSGAAFAAGKTLALIVSSNENRWIKDGALITPLM
jgi:hypothetical protein